MADCETDVASLFASAQGVNATEIASILCAKFAVANDAADAASAAASVAGDAVTGLNAQFLVWAGALVFVMHAGRWFSVLSPFSSFLNTPRSLERSIFSFN